MNGTPKQPNAAAPAPDAWAVLDADGRLLYASLSKPDAQEWVDRIQQRELRPLYLEPPPPPAPVAYRRPYKAPRGPGYWLVPPGGPVFEGDEPLYAYPPPRRIP